MPRSVEPNLGSHLFLLDEANVVVSCQINHV
jgi:hypothetical protein